MPEWTLLLHKIGAALYNGSGMYGSLLVLLMAVIFAVFCWGTANSLFEYFIKVADIIIAKN